MKKRLAQIKMQDIPTESTWITLWTRQLKCPLLEEKTRNNGGSFHQYMFRDMDTSEKGLGVL